MDLPAPEPIQQSTALPYRWQDGRLEFCLITSLQKKHWAFPKGVIDPGETAQQAALKEASEEAGIAGEIVGEPLGRYSYSKWNKSYEVTLWLMQVAEVHEQWQEADRRERLWAGPEQSKELIARPELRQIVDVAVARLMPSATV
jgi:8-oxo-dGTP pyrophosphatase MutT (NUDIX family)